MSLTKNWVKIIYKELFRPESIEIYQVLKDILFLLMDSFDPNYMLKQYCNLNDKVCQDIDNMNKYEKIPKNIILQLSILEGSFNKT